VRNVLAARNRGRELPYTRLSGQIGILYRGQVKALETESRRKDELIDELVKQIGRTADVQDRTVSVVEQRERGRR
jgi:hypothetical protein